MLQRFIRVIGIFFWGFAALLVIFNVNNLHEYLAGIIAAGLVGAAALYIADGR